MRTLTRITLSAFLFLFIAQSAISQKRGFDKWGLTFSHAGNWSITEQEEIAPGNFYVSVEKKGDNSSGIAMYMWSSGNVDLQQRLSLYEQSMGANIPGAKFGEYTEGNYGQYSGIKLPYTFSIGGLEHQATMYCFHAGDQTMVVILQEALEDIKSNKSGFKKLEESFKVD